MKPFFSIRVEFLHDRFHGRGEGAAPEWPPSPLRLFQALTAACAGVANERIRITTFADALRWLERQSAPLIAAPQARLAKEPYRLYVPNNTGDLAAASWSSAKTQDKDLSRFRTEKDVQPYILPSKEGLYYVWAVGELREDERALAEMLREAVASITHLGWGIDQVVAEANWLSEEEVDELPGVRYSPVDRPGVRVLPAAVPGTFDALTERHQAALGRIRREDKRQVFSPVPRMTVLRPVNYARDDDPVEKPYRVFELLPTTADTTAHFQAYDPVKETTVLAGMVRHHFNDPKFHAQLGWVEADLAMLHGHGEKKGSGKHQPVSGNRIAIVPLPSIEWRGNERGDTVGSTRRLMLVGIERKAEGSAENRLKLEAALDDVAHLLSGRQLQPATPGIPASLLRPIAPDKMAERYTKCAATWETVTPVVLPGFDDPGGLRKKLSARKQTGMHAQEKNAIVEQLESRIEQLLRKAIVQAGYPPVLAANALLEWRGTGYLPGTALTKDYFAPAHLQPYRKYHVRITWRDASGQRLPIPGPIVLGGGRFFGLGLLTAGEAGHL